MKKLIIIMLLLAFSLTGCGIFQKSQQDSANEDIKNNTEEEQQEEKDKAMDNIITLCASGDILVHETQLISQYNKESNSYDFTDNFRYVKKYIEEADYAITNLETTLAGEEKVYSGYPIFNTPDSILDALKYAGFDGLTLSNNHIIDKGYDGFIRTAEQVKKSGMDMFGVKTSEQEKTYVIKDIKGVKFGISNYTFETVKKKGNRTINSLVIPSAALELFDRFNYNELDINYEAMKQRIETMKQEGAEVIVFAMHWGNEYERTPNSYQKQMAQKLADLGVDIIIGGHPHVIQPMEYLTSEVSGKKTLVLYSLGNFISNQRREIINNKYTEDGIIVNISLEKLPGGGAKVKSVNFIPTWVSRKQVDENKYSYTILPLNEVAETSSSEIPLEQEELSKAIDSYEETIETFKAFSTEPVLAPIMD